MRNKGFTLVELLIVIAIIAALMMLGATNWIAQQQKARDARRKADLTQIQAALEMYRTDHTSYPTDADNTWDYDAITLATALTPYISEMPRDPKTENNYLYQDAGDSSGANEGQVYILTADEMEREVDYVVRNP